MICNSANASSLTDKYSRNQGSGIAQRISWYCQNTGHLYESSTSPSSTTAYMSSIAVSPILCASGFSNFMWRLCLQGPPAAEKQVCSLCTFTHQVQQFNLERSGCPPDKSRAPSEPSEKHLFRKLNYDSVSSGEFPLSFQSLPKFVTTAFSLAAWMC